MYTSVYINTYTYKYPIEILAVVQGCPGVASGSSTHKHTHTHTQAHTHIFVILMEQFAVVISLQ